MSLYNVCHAKGGMTGFEWERDPKRLAFILARYKHVAKILEGHDSVLEVGCADGFGSRVVRQHVKELVAVDIDPISIFEAKDIASEAWPIDFRMHDILSAPVGGGFTAAYALDLFEHFHPGSESQRFLENLCLSAPVAVIGTPSLESQRYASKLSLEGHVNCLPAPELKLALEDHWEHVFLFGINDETLHTGFAPMCQYRLALCVR